MCIIYHVSKLLPKDSQSNFILMALNYITRCCLGQQYSMRLYAQVNYIMLSYKLIINYNHINILFIIDYLCKIIQNVGRNEF